MGQKLCKIYKSMHTIDNRNKYIIMLIFFIIEITSCIIVKKRHNYLINVSMNKKSIYLIRWYYDKI